MKRIILVFFLLPAVVEGPAQSVIGCLGGEGSAGDIRLDYTAGEAMTSTMETDSLVLTQGFHQPSYVITAIEETFPGVTVTVFPNPTAGIIEARFENAAPEDIFISISDMAGKTILAAEVKTSMWQGDLSHLPAGSYILSITGRESKRPHSFKILKTR